MIVYNCLIVLILTTVLKCVHSRQQLRGVTVESPPFVMKAGDGFKGYAVDLINELSKIGDFDYTLYESPDKKYGSSDVTGRPNGMIQEVYMARADFALADLTKSMLRERYINFTEPFMRSDLTALIHKKNKVNISSFEDLLYQQEITYGTLREGETYRFMSLSADPTLSSLQRYIYRNAYNLVNSRQEGIEKALNTKYAFIQESVANEYAMDHNCELTVVDNEREYYPREYAIGVHKPESDNPKYGNLLKMFNQGLAKLKRDGVLDKLKRKYWNQHCLSGALVVNTNAVTVVGLIMAALFSYLLLN